MDRQYWHYGHEDEMDECRCKAVVDEGHDEVYYTDCECSQCLYQNYEEEV